MMSSHSTMLSRMRFLDLDDRAYVLCAFLALLDRTGTNIVLSYLDLTVWVDMAGDLPKGSLFLKNPPHTNFSMKVFFKN